MTFGPPTIPGYRLLERIGSGGFGTVYAAEREHPFGQRVAVKVLNPGMDSARIVDRFAAERQVLALMDHPNIAKLLDAGVDDAGRPFVAMEFVEGVPITGFCREHGLPTSTRLELFVDVCRGVHHAHQKGIVHCDLKPQNVLVAQRDGRAVPKVIDFGIARVADRGRGDPTRPTGELLGTPAYMSPEQAEPGQTDVDTRSDVYSLGCILYELLCGTPPFSAIDLRRLSPSERERVLRGVDPPTPGERIRHRQRAAASQAAAPAAVAPVEIQRPTRDLDWITMKALSKERDRRYSSASDLAADVERCLRHEPVVAHPPSTWYRLNKFVQRNRGPCAAASAVLLALITALVAVLATLQRAVAAHRSEAAARAWERQATDPLRMEDLLRRARAPWPQSCDPERDFAAWQAWLDEADEVLVRGGEHETALRAAGQGGNTRLRALQRMLGQLPELRRWHADVAGRRAILTRHWPLWQACRRSILSVPEFAGVELEPLPNLLPLGIDRDRNSHLGRQVGPCWVFAVGGTGSIPRWVDEHGTDVAYGEPGVAVLTPDAAVLLVLVPGGSGWCGAQTTDPGAPNYEADLLEWCARAEQPVHRVTLSAFLLAKCEVTNQQFLRFASATGQPPPDHVADPRFRGDDLPVVSVEAREAAAFCTWLGLRLPSEAEWEYACRAGTATRFWFGDAESELAQHAWFNLRHQPDSHPRPVARPPSGRPAPNPWGLHDMLGNVSEFCSDDWFRNHVGAPTDGTPRRGGSMGTVRRGGDWRGGHMASRSASRSFDQRHGQDVRGGTVGFRAARDLR